MKAIAARVDGDLGAVGLAWDCGSSATNPEQLAGEILGTGVFAAKYLADVLMSGRGRRAFYRALTPANGIEAGTYFAHCLTDASRAGEGRTAEANPVLLDAFPLSARARERYETIVSAYAESEYGFDERDARPDLTAAGLGLVMDQRAARKALDMDPDPRSPEMFLLGVRFTIAWGHLHRVMFRQVDPDGFSRWAERVEFEGTP